METKHFKSSADETVKKTFPKVNVHYQTSEEDMNPADVILTLTQCDQECLRCLPLKALGQPGFFYFVNLLIMYIK